MFKLKWQRFNLEKLLNENKEENLISALKKEVPQLKKLEEIQELNLQYQGYEINDPSEFDEKSISLKYFSYVNKQIYDVPLRYLKENEVIKRKTMPCAMHLSGLKILEKTPKKETCLFFKNNQVQIKITFYLKK